MSVRGCTLAILVVLLSLSKCTYGSIRPGFQPFPTVVLSRLYVVYLGALPKGSTSEEIVSSHIKLLSILQKSEEVARSSLVISYYKSFNAFAAMITPKEAAALQGMPEVVSVFPNQVKQLFTTRSWDFVGLTASAPRNTTVESEIIVGIIDTGVWPESKMFDDTSFGPIPSRWRGECQIGDQFTTQNCNKKLIGAKYFHKGYEHQAGDVNRFVDYMSARDINGHGSHASSIATGSAVEGASLYGIAQGTARGAVPAARLAMYKVCWGEGAICTDVDILAAFDHAIYDGVDLISISMGAAYAAYSIDGIAIGSFHAVQNGIFVSGAVGNQGFGPSYAVNIAPWILTVAASSIDRQFYTPILLGNNVTIEGVSINTFEMNHTWYPLISGAQGDLANATSDLSYCDKGDLDEAKVKGKIVYCEAGGSTFVEESVLDTRGAGIIFAGQGLTALPSVHLLPQSNLENGSKVIEYINTASSPTAKILHTQAVLGQLPAPLTAYFSTRGPNYISWDILKPDISAPGEGILAAWSSKYSISNDDQQDDRHTLYNILYGTSVATPHATGTAAYVKSFHPDWSPAAIKSAIMTTAIPFDPTNPLNSDLELGYGAGQINPTKAIDPGLVFDIENYDYMMFLCTHGYNSADVKAILGDSNVQCPDNTTITYSMNYPAISVGIPIYMKDNWYTSTRILTNVGVPPNITYIAKLVVPDGMEVDISPKVLSFSKLYEKQSFEVKARARTLGQNANILSASLTWTSETYNVRSPIVIFVSND